MRKRTLVLNDRDNVASALTDLQPGEQVPVFGPAGSVQQIQLRQAVPLGHKLAIQAIGCGEVIVKYGMPIGLATQDIKAGEHVHIHNVTGEGMDA